MERRDVLKEEFEQFGKVFGEIVREFLGLNAHGISEQNIEEPTLQLQDNLDINPAEMLQFDEKELEAYFLKNKFSGTHIELLSDYFAELGEYYLDKNRSLTEKYA